MSDASREILPSADLIRRHSGGVTEAEYLVQGDTDAQMLKDAVGLQPHHWLLDVGCGAGRLARPLIKHFSDKGGYCGLDITREVIDWCKETYRHYPNFDFQHADIYNKEYNPGGQYKASEYNFPYRDETFDVAFLSSVFTHMLPRDMANYLAEIARVLKPGGRCIITYFLLNPESQKNIAAGLTTPSFPFTCGAEGCRVWVEEIPESAIAYDEQFLGDLYRKYGLTIEAVSYGRWGRGEFVPHEQDVVWAVK